MEKRLIRTEFADVMMQGIVSGLRALWAIDTIEALSGRAISEMTFSDNGMVASVALGSIRLPDDEFEKRQNRYNEALSAIVEALDRK